MNLTAHGKSRAATRQGRSAVRTLKLGTRFLRRAHSGCGFEKGPTFGIFSDSQLKSHKSKLRYRIQGSRIGVTSNPGAGFSSNVAGCERFWVALFALAAVLLIAFCIQLDSRMKPCRKRMDPNRQA